MDNLPRNQMMRMFTDIHQMKKDIQTIRSLYMINTVLNLGENEMSDEKFDELMDKITKMIDAINHRTIEEV